MYSSIFRLNVKDVLSQVASISIAVALTLVFLGPVVDHHYVCLLYTSDAADE